MSREESGVELDVIDRVAALSAAFSRWYKTLDFDVFLKAEAAARVHEELQTIVGNQAEMGINSGNFLLKLMISKFSEETEAPRMADWMGVRFKYELNEEGDLQLAPQFFITGNIVPEPTEPPEVPVVTMDWDEFNWMAGYSILLNDGRADLPNPN